MNHLIPSGQTTFRVPDACEILGRCQIMLVRVVRLHSQIISLPFITAVMLWLDNNTDRFLSRSSVLLLAPLLAEADPAPRRVSRPTGSAGAQGTDGLCPRFRWMADHVPAFRVPGTRIHILTSPDQFYQAMKVGVPVDSLQLQTQEDLLVLMSHNKGGGESAADVFPAESRCRHHLSRQSITLPLTGVHCSARVSPDTSTTNSFTEIKPA